jgi:Pathogenicity locus
MTRKANHARLATGLESIPNVGVSIARDLRSIGIKKPRDLIGRNPYSLYRMLCDRTRTRQDPCVLDTFISAVDFMEGAPARPWWSYTAARKKKFSKSLLTRQSRRSLTKAGRASRKLATVGRRK